MAITTSLKLNKNLGQHFLTDASIAQRIAFCLPQENHFSSIIEIGPGMGALTTWLVQRGFTAPLFLIEYDKRFIAPLQEKYTSSEATIWQADALNFDFNRLPDGPVAVIGNFPYNISSPLFFKLFAERDRVTEVVCMVQHEVALRLASPPKRKTYGLLSLLMQTFYTIDYCFDVPPEAFNPPPKVVSGVLHLKRNNRKKLPIDESFYIQCAKAAFGQRRKILRNALSMLGKPLNALPERYLKARAESLTVQEFLDVVQILSAQ